MKTLLVHDSDYQEVGKVNTWREKREGINDFFQLSVNAVASFILNGVKNEDAEYVEKQIKKAIENYGIEKVLIFLNKEYEDEPKSYLEAKMPELKFAYVVHH